MYNSQKETDLVVKQFKEADYVKNKRGTRDELRTEKVAAMMKQRNS